MGGRMPYGGETGGIFDNARPRVKTYWQKCDNENNITEFEFQNIPELTELHGTVLPGEEYEDLILPLAVAAFKLRKRDILPQDTSEMRESGEGTEGYNDENELDGGAEDEFVIPELCMFFDGMNVFGLWI